MKTYWGIALCCLLFVGCHTSKRPVLYGLLDEESPLNLSVLQQQHPNDEGVYLFYKHDISHDLKPDFKNNAPRWYFFESYHWREVVLQETEEEQTVLDFSLASFEKIRKVNYRVIKPDGTEFGYSKSDLVKDKIGGDSTRFTVQIEALPVGSVVEAAYEIERGDLYKHLPLSHDVALQLEKPVREMAFAYTYPWDWRVQVKQIGEQRELMLSETESDDTETKTLHYKASQVPAFAQRQFGPYLKEVAPYFHVQVDKMEIGNVLVYESPEAWEEIANQFARHAKTPGRKTDGAIRKVLAELNITEGMPAREKIDVILAHVQQDITPHYRSRLEDVVKKQRGDAYAITTYTQALLAHAGVETSYLVAHSAEGGNFDETFITEEQMYRPVLKVEDMATGVYLFPSLARVPLGFIPSEFEQQPALNYKDGQFEGFTTIAPSNANVFADNSSFEVFINSEGEARVEAQLSLGHNSAYQFFQRAGDAQAESALIKQLLPHDDRHIDGLVYDVAVGAWGNPTMIKTEYGLEDCVRQDGDTVVFRSCGFFDAMHKGWAEFRLPSRMPADEKIQSQLTNQVTVTYPAGWTLLTEVKEVAETVAGGRFTRAVNAGTGRLEVEQALTLARQAVQPISMAATDVVNLPARASLPLLEMTTAPVFAELEGQEIEPGGPWTLVMKTFASIKEAEQEATRYRTALADQGYDINVLIDGNAPGEYRLVLGTFATRTGIESARDALGEAIPFDTWMLSLKPQMTAVSGKPEPVMQ